MHEELAGKTNRPGAPGLVEELGKLAAPTKEHGRPRLDTDVNKCVLAVTEAYQRRGTALPVVGVISWPQHKKMREFHIDALRHEPPEGRSDLMAATFHDVMVADKLILNKLNEFCKDGTRPDNEGLLVGRAMPTVLQDRQILALVDFERRPHQNEAQADPH